LDIKSIVRPVTTAHQAKFAAMRLSQVIIVIIIMFVIIHVITIIMVILLILQQVQLWFLSIHAWDFASFFVLLHALEEKEELTLSINSSQ